MLLSFRCFSEDTTLYFFRLMLIRLLIPFQIFFMLFELSAGEESVTVVLFTQPSKSTYSVPIKFVLYKVT